MKKLALLSTFLVLVLSIISCNGHRNKQVAIQTVNSRNVAVYYFHFTRRCATCMAVEENARKAVVALYPNEVKAGEYSFTSLNLDEANTKGIANKLSIRHTLNIVLIRKTGRKQECYSPGSLKSKKFENIFRVFPK